MVLDLSFLVSSAKSPNLLNEFEWIECLLWWADEPLISTLEFDKKQSSAKSSRFHLYRSSVHFLDLTGNDMIEGKH